MTDDRDKFEQGQTPSFLEKEFTEHNAEHEHYALVKELLKSPVGNPRQELHIRSRTKHAGATSVFDSVAKTIKRPFFREAGWNDCMNLLKTWSVEFEHREIGEKGEARKEITQILAAREPVVQQENIIDKMKKSAI